jgi:hypothetical protein
MAANNVGLRPHINKLESLINQQAFQACWYLTRALDNLAYLYEGMSVKVFWPQLMGTHPSASVGSMGPGTPGDVRGSPGL